MAALRYRAVLFDLDGTLVDSYAALADAVNYARRTHGLPALDQAQVKGLVGDGIEKLLQRAFEMRDVPADVRKVFETRYDEVCCEQSRILEDVEKTLRELSALGIAMAVCTNKPTSFSKKILDFLNLSEHFRAIVGPDVAGARKPDPQHVLRTLRETACAIEEALFVGDMPVDIEAAHNSGIDVAVLATGSSSIEQLRDAGPDHMLARFSDLVAVVRA
jgi:phosphoglycolate phosphatase